MRNFSWPLGDMCFADCFEGINTLRILLPDLHDFTETTLAYNLQQIEYLNCQRIIATWFEVDFKMERTCTGCSCVPLVGGVLRHSGH